MVALPLGSWPNDSLWQGCALARRYMAQTVLTPSENGSSVGCLLGLVERIRATGRTAAYRFTDNEWQLSVDERVARGASQGHLIDAGERWWRNRQEPPGESE